MPKYAKAPIVLIPSVQGPLCAGDFGATISEDAQVQAALERAKEFVIALPQGTEKIRSQFMRFSHLWTRPLAEALQVLWRSWKRS